MDASFNIISTYLQDSSLKNRDELILQLHSRLRSIVGWICQASIPNHKETSDAHQFKNLSEKWSNFPFSSHWQTEELFFLSKRSFNLGVGCNVSCFSGWEHAEFDLKLIRRNEGPSYFGVHLNETQVVGYLQGDKEAELSSQWKMLDRIVPILPDLNFDDAVKCIKHEDWYRHAMLNLEGQFSNVVIARYGEEEALDIIMMYSKLCLELAKGEDDQAKQSCLLASAMSVILPLVSKILFQKDLL